MSRHNSWKSGAGRPSRCSLTTSGKTSCRVSSAISAQERACHSDVTKCDAAHSRHTLLVAAA
eukprot:scaffold20686_cov79-Phaeocystis_antarctica.AAC.5